MIFQAHLEREAFLQRTVEGFSNIFDFPLGTVAMDSESEVAISQYEEHRARDRRDIF